MSIFIKRKEVVKPTLRLIRVFEDADGAGTFGVIVDEKGLAVCRTAELNWRSNKQDISCIPSGTYECTPHLSTTHGNCFAVNDVVGRSKILIHVGNWAGRKNTDRVLSNTEGCILPGLSVGRIRDTRTGINQLAVTSSAVIMKALLANYKEGFTLIIEGV